MPSEEITPPRRQPYRRIVEMLLARSDAEAVAEAATGDQHVALAYNRGAQVLYQAARRVREMADEETP
jgi:hypothetical protein